MEVAEVKGMQWVAWEADVEAFHQKYGHPVREAPGVPVNTVVNFRHRLIHEECEELRRELSRIDYQQFRGHPVESAQVAAVGKEIVDLMYVLIGTALAFGVPLAPVWDAVHWANMTKTKAAEGKPVKGADYVPPDIESLLESA